MTHPVRGVSPPRPPERGPNVLLAGLTPEQAAAVRHGRGPLLVLAGPGTGKTRTLIHRVAYLLASGHALPRQILAVTFSVRAAGELRLRLAELLGDRSARGVTAATFHSVCARLLREHAAVFGRSEHYTIYDQADLRHVIEALLSDPRRAEIRQALNSCGRPSAAATPQDRRPRRTADPRPRSTDGGKASCPTSPTRRCWSSTWRCCRSSCRPAPRCGRSCCWR